MRKARVYYKGEYAGLIEEDAEGYVFTYDAGYLASPTAMAVSLTMPLGAQPVRSSTLHPFFDGLIPEGWLLSVVVKNWKISERDRMGLLLTVCNDCIGAVSVEACDE
jgi:serine/threonine-protein kinase HipA